MEIDHFITSNYDGNDYFIIYENDCRWYPNANIQIKFDNWIDTKRGKDKKQIYIFKGPSAIGKSYIANSTNLEVFETDGRPLNELNISFDIIVVGNKHGYTTRNIISEFKEDNLKNIEFILVGFKKI